jgi:hypothetical protein
MAVTDHIHMDVVINFSLNLERSRKIILYILPVGERSGFIGGIVYRFVHFACTGILFLCAVLVRGLSGNILPSCS